MKPIDPAGFEALFQAGIDPWNYRASRFEAVKRRALLHACGDRTFGRALELACAIGETSRALQPRCLRLMAVDSSPTAVAYACKAHGRIPRLCFAEAWLPGGMPRGPFDLIVLSELAYYLAPRVLGRLMRRIERELAPGGSLVVLHHVIPFADAAQLPALAQRRATSWPGSHLREAARQRTARYEVVTLRKPARRDVSHTAFKRNRQQQKTARA